MRTDAEVRRVAEQFQLGLPRSPVSGRAGELLGRGAGSSLEFQEHRQYLPGDDIRHLDWAAYARTDALMIRMYREEISPRTQIVLDVTRSMTTTGEKSRLARQLAGALSLMAGLLGARATVTLAGGAVPPRQLQGDELELLQEMPLEGRGDLADLVQRGQLPLRPRSALIVISDFLFPHDPVVLIRRLGGESSLFWVVQVLTEWESAPDALGGRRLIDCESSESIDLRVNAMTIQRYSGRLTALQSRLRESVRRCGGTFVTVIADRGLYAVCSDDLCRAGILRPR